MTAKDVISISASKIVIGKNVYFYANNEIYSFALGKGLVFFSKLVYNNNGFDKYNYHKHIIYTLD